MKNCPVCGIPVEENQPQCTYCGANVNGVAEAEPVEAAGAEGNPVPIATYTSLVEAEACKSKLEAAGVAAMVDSGAASDASSQYASAPRHIQLWVRDTDAEKAMAILSEGGEANSHAPAHAVSDDQSGFTDLAGSFSAPPAAHVAEAGDAEEQPQEIVVPVHSVRTLESKLSALMDEYDTPGWTVNPAMHPAVLAFIEENSHNREFMKRAKSLQENRASYYATMRAKENTVAASSDTNESDEPAELEPVEEAGEIPTMAAEPSIARSVFGDMPPKRRRSPVLMILLVLILVPIAVVMGTSMYFRHVGENKLQEAVTAARAKGPLSWDELKAGRAEVPEAANTVPMVEDLAKQLADKQVNPPAQAAELLRQEPNVPITDAQAKALYAELRKAGRAFLVANKKLDPRPDASGKHPVGRLPDRSVDEVLTQKLAYLESARKAVDVLLIAGMLDAQQGKPEGALARARQVVTIGRSVGDTADPAALRFRLECWRLAAASIERTLALARPGDQGALVWKTDLRRTQKLLEDEGNQPLLTLITRGQRALKNEVLSRIDVNADNAPADKRALVFHLTSPDGALASREHWLKLGTIMENHAQALDLLTRLIEVSAVQDTTQYAKFREVEQSAAELEGNSAKALIKQVASEAVAETRAYFVSRTELRLAIVGIAAERFRIAQKRWPASIQELATASGKFLGDAPIDLFDGQPLRMKPFGGGLMIYSVGPDGKDNEGTYDRADAGRADTDLVFRLWTPKK